MVILREFPSKNGAFIVWVGNISGFQKIGDFTPQIIHNRISMKKTIHLGENHLYFWKHPCTKVQKHQRVPGYFVGHLDFLKRKLVVIKGMDLFMFVGHLDFLKRKLREYCCWVAVIMNDHCRLP